MQMLHPSIFSELKENPEFSIIITTCDGIRVHLTDIYDFSTWLEHISLYETVIIRQVYD